MQVHPGHPRNFQVPPGLEGILPADPMERRRMILEQERLERMYRGGPNGPPPGHPHHHHLGPFGPHGMDHLYNMRHVPLPDPNLGDVQGFVNRMGELLQLREAQRQRRHAIRRREQQALEEYQIHRIAHPERPNNRGAEGPPGPPGQPPNPIGPIGPPPHQYNVQQGRHGPIGGPINPMPAHNVVPAAPIPPPPPAHGGREVCIEKSISEVGYNNCESPEWTAHNVLRAI